MTSGPVRARSQRKESELCTSSRYDHLDDACLRLSARVVSAWYPKQGLRYGPASYLVRR